MSSSEKFITLNTDHEFKFKEKGSLFIGQAYITDSVEAAEQKLAEIRKKYYDATHNCYAYNIFSDEFKYSDDGEPNGTAGIRIYNALQHFSIVNALVIVTRYFGGVKLGVGPLGKAYYNGAYGVLNEVSKRSRELYHQISILYDFDMTSNIHHFLGQNDVKKMDSKFEGQPEITCYILPEKIVALNENLTQVSKGKIKMEVIGKNFLI